MIHIVMKNERGRLCNHDPWQASLLTAAASTVALLMSFLSCHSSQRMARLVLDHWTRACVRQLRDVFPLQYEAHKGMGAHELVRECVG